MKKLEVPEKYDDREDPDRFWPTDPFDQYLPSTRGFLTDFIYATRGVEAPTMFGIWSAIFVLMTAIKREAWIRWFPKPLFPNMYIILVAPPGVCRKSTIVNYAVDVLEGFGDFIEDPNFREVKKLALIKNKATPEALLDAMLPIYKGKPVYTFLDVNGQPMKRKGKFVRYHRTSEIGIALSEMAVMLNKQKYSESMIENLMDLYDPHNHWEWRTMGRGVKVLSNLCTSFLAATTPEGFRNSVPQTATGDGFLSRTIVAYQNKTTRRYPFPSPVKNGPQMVDLQKRLAFVAENMQGEYLFSKGATELYIDFYNKHKDEIEMATEEKGLISRIDVQVVKLALLMKAQNYESTGREISEQEFMEASIILNATLKFSPMVIRQVKDDAGFWIQYERIADYLKTHGRIPRSKVIQNTRIDPDLLNRILFTLSKEDAIDVYRNKTKMSRPTGRGGEVYEWRKENFKTKDSGTGGSKPKELDKKKAGGDTGKPELADKESTDSKDRDGGESGRSGSNGRGKAPSGKGDRSGRGRPRRVQREQSVSDGPVAETVVGADE
jgi:hypothetical protein